MSLWKKIKKVFIKPKRNGNSHATDKLIDLTKTSKSKSVHVHQYTPTLTITEVVTDDDDYEQANVDESCKTKTSNKQKPSQKKSRSNSRVHHHKHDFPKKVNEKQPEKQKHCFDYEETYDNHVYEANHGPKLYFYSNSRFFRNSRPHFPIVFYPNNKFPSF